MRHKWRGPPLVNSGLPSQLVVGRHSWVERGKEGVKLDSGGCPREVQA